MIVVGSRQLSEGSVSYRKMHRVFFELLMGRGPLEVNI